MAVENCDRVIALFLSIFLRKGVSDLMRGEDIWGVKYH